LASARQHLLQAIKIEGNSPSAARSHYLLAQVLAEQDEIDKALHELLIATSLRPNYAEAYLAQGLIRRKQLNEVEATKAFKKAVELSPQDFDARYQLGAAYRRSGNTSQAIGHLRQASKLKPGDRSTLYQLCRALKAAGRAEETQACEQELSAAIKAGVEVTANLLTATQSNNEGVELEKAGNLAAALEKYREAVKLDPTQSVFRRNLGLALCRLGRWDEGLAELQEVLRENSDDPEATKALYIALENTRKTKTTGTAAGEAPPEPK
jgi:tetratricopeptide (TPR) repeat protein